MKIGVLTYHIDLNPGATLQCYATCRALEELGHEVYIIDLYHYNGNPLGIRAILNSITNYRSIRGQKHFRKQFFPPFTKHYRNIMDLRNDPPKLDAYCIGSDQVWNVKIAGADHMAYFLDFGEDKVMRFSYASSIGGSTWPIKDEAENRRIKELFGSYKGLSVREETAKRIIDDKFGIKPELVCDPVLLHKDYKEITGDVEETNEVSCFIFQRTDRLLEALHYVAEWTGKPLRMVTSVKPIKGFLYTSKRDLRSWLRYMSGSVFNVTDSFHGTVVSIIYHKPFAVVYQENGLSSRITDLLKTVGLEDRIFFDVNEFKQSDKWKQPIDWEDVDKRLETVREKSWNYLRDILNDNIE